MALCGIDLGTTNSLIAEFRDGAPRLIPNVLGEVLTPSAVGIDDDGTVLVGRPALERLLTHPDRTVAGFKRFMGTAHETRLGRRAFRSEELSAFVLRALKADAEAALGAALGEVVISVPAYFNDLQRKATLDAGRLAGLTVTRLVNEPTAAALAYGFGGAAEGKYLVFDLGGGTFDVSILDKYEGLMEIRATTGDTRLGGDDFRTLVEERIARAHGRDATRLSPTDAAALRRAAEAAKLMLSARHEADYVVGWGSGAAEGRITRDAFELDATPLMRRLRAPMERAMADARLAPGDLDAVVLVGGATRMPMVRAMVARLFGRLPLVHLDADTTVALGAAVQAGLAGRDAALDDVVMTDVCPHTLGIAVADSPDDPHLLHIVPIIERNAVVPISRTRTFSTIRDDQSAVDVQVFQGEHLRPTDNVALGRLRIAVPRGPRGEQAIDVRFTYDINGVLEVEVTARATRAVERAIFGRTAGLDEAELQRRFAELAGIKLHPRDQMENRELLARAERLYAENLGQAREAIRLLILRFEAEIADQRARDPAGVRATFASVLDRVERRIFD